jgi:hypothetical protein
MGFWKNVGKIASIAAPIVAAPFTGGASLALIGAGSGAASGLLNGGGAKGALIGGLLGGATAGIGGGAGNAAKGATSVAKAGVGSTLKTVGTNLAKDAAGGFINKLLSGDTLDAAGKGVAGVAATEAHNRGTKLDATMAGDEMKRLADVNNRDAGVQGMKQMQIAEYLAGGGFHPTDQPVLAGGKTATKFNFGTAPATEAEKQYAGNYSKQLMDRQAHPVQLSDYSKLMDPGTMEKTLNWISPILSTLGAARGAGKYLSPEQIAAARAGAQQQPATPQLPPVEFKMPVTAPRSPYDVFKRPSDDFGVGSY